MTARDDGWTAGRPGVPDEPGRREDGGAAFPTGPNSLPGYASQGMTLRDWFAGQALTGLLAVQTTTLDDAVEMAWRVADTMLRERR